MEGRELVAISAALIAAVLAVAKLVADKESRISDFRKDWINSYRAALSEMLGEAYVIAGRIRIRTKHAKLTKSGSTGGKDPSRIATAAPAAGTTSSEAVTAANHTTLLADNAVQVVVTISTSPPSNVVAATQVQPSVIPQDQSPDPDVTAAASAEVHERDGLFSAEEILDLEKDLTSHWNTLRKAHRTVLLHMNFNETAWGIKGLGKSVAGNILDHRLKAANVWSDITNSIDLVDKGKAARAYEVSKNGDPSGAAALLVDQLDDLVGKLLGEYHIVGEKGRYEEIKMAIDRSTLLGNMVLKPEWNRIKGGEPKFNWVVFGLWALALVGFAALLYFSLRPERPKDPAMPTEVIVQMKDKLSAETLTCPQMIELGERWTGRGPISSNLPWCPPPGF